MDLPTPAPEHAEEFNRTVEKLRAVYLQIRELQTSRASRSHAGPALALRSLLRQKTHLESQILRLAN